MDIGIYQSSLLAFGTFIYERPALVEAAKLMDTKAALAIERFKEGSYEQLSQIRETISDITECAAVAMKSRFNVIARSLELHILLSPFIRNIANRPGGYDFQKSREDAFVHSPPAFTGKCFAPSVKESIILARL